MKDYLSYSTNDFVLDEYFRKGVLQPTAENQNFWSNFGLLHPEKENELEQARRMVEMLRQARPSSETHQLEQAWNLLNTRVNEYEERRKTRVVPLLLRYGIAASIVLGLLLSGFWWYAAQPALVTHQTDFNETKIIRLPDGSTVNLNANSTLSFRDDWSATLSERRVTLRGEAFFAVEKNLVQSQDSAYFSKFIVQTAQLEIVVLGTRFNVNDHVANTQVALEAGKVLVQIKDGKGIHLIPGEIAELLDNQLHKKTSEVETVSSWKDSKLIFKQTPVPQILEMIESRYGYRIEYSTVRLNDKHYTGSSPADDVDLLLYKLSRLYGLSIQQEGNNISLTTDPLR